MSFEKNIKASRIDGLIAEITSLGGLAGSGTLNYVAKFTPDGATLGAGSIFDNGTNIGIGTNTPNYKLELIGSNNSTIFLVGDLTTSIGTAIIGSRGLFGTTSSHDLGLITAGSERLTITSGGNVGIGTSSPLTKLHVDGGSGSNVQIYLKATGVDNGIQIDSGAYPFFNMKSNGVTNITMQGVGSNIIFRPNQNVEWRAGDTNSSMFGSNSMDVAASSYSYYNHNLMVGGSTPAARFHVKGLDNGAVNYALKVENSLGGNLFSIRNDGAFVSYVYDTTYDINLGGSAGHYKLQTAWGDKFEAYPSSAFTFTTGANIGTSLESGITNIYTPNFSTSNPWNVVANRILVGSLGGNTGTITGFRIEKSGFTNTSATFYSAILLDGNVGVGLTTPSLAKLQIRGIDATSSNNALYVDDSAGSSLLQVRNDGYARFSSNHGNGVSSFTIFNSNTGAGFDFKSYYGRLALGTANTTVQATLSLTDYGTVQNFINFDNDGLKGTIFGLGGGITFLGKQSGSNRFIISSDDGWLGNSGYRTWFKGRISIGDTPSQTGDMIRIEALADLLINQTFGTTNAIPTGWVLVGDFVIDPPASGGGFYNDCDVSGTSGNSKLFATDSTGGFSTATYTFDATNHTNIKIKWNEYLESLGFLLTVKASYDGFGTYTTLTPTHPTVIQTWTAVPIINLPATFNNRSSIQLRFEYTPTNGGNSILIDDLIITGETVALRTVTGKVVIGDLSGSGTRTVNVDDNGKLIIGSAPLSGATSKYATTFTPGTVTVANTITHSLGTTDISVTLWDLTSGEMILANIGNRTSSTVDITFSMNPAGNVRAVIIG